MTTDKKKEEELQPRTVASGYTPLDVSGNDYASMVGMSDVDKAAIEAARQSYNQASAAGNKGAMDAAHQQAEAIRAKYGYSGGVDGSQYLPDASSGSFSYAQAPTYVSKYQDQINALTARLMGAAPFSYDPDSDPTYQQYKESYTRSGERAMQDTLGQIAARTGGLASSYAASASQQAYDNYMAALADKVPELEQLAYSMYLDEQSALRSNLNTLLSLEQSEYAKYLDALSQYNADRNFAYGQFTDERNFDYQTDRDALADERYDQQWDYQLSRDAISDSRYDQEWDYQLSRDKLEDQRYAQQWAAAQAQQAQQSDQSDQQQRSAAYDTISKRAAQYKDAEEAMAYLERAVEGGYITEEEAAFIYLMELGAQPPRQVSVPSFSYQDMLSMAPAYASQAGYPNDLKQMFTR